MGSAVRIFYADAEHIIAQSKIDAARKTQAAHNAAQMTLTEARKTVQSGNNYASTVLAGAQTSLRDARNSASEIVTTSRNNLRVAQNDGAVVVANAQKAVQTQYNTSNLQLRDIKRQGQGEVNEAALALMAAETTIQTAKNQAAASGATVTRWEASLRNQQILKQAGDKMNEITDTVLAISSQAATGTIFDRLQAATAMGSLIADASASGVGGSSVAAFNTSMRLAQALKEDAKEREVRGKVTGLARSRYAVFDEAVGSMVDTTVNVNLDYTPPQDRRDLSYIGADQNFDAIIPNIDYGVDLADKDFTQYIADIDRTVYTPDLDYTQYVDHKKMSFLQKWFTLNTAAVATYFGGPQAGMAVTDASMSIYEAKNGNYQAAQQYGNSVLANGMAGFKTYRAGANSSNPNGSAWGANLKI